MQLVEVNRAHFYAESVRYSYVQLPVEDERAKAASIYGELRRTMYGILDAAEQCELHYSRTLEAAVFVRSTTNPCNFHQPGKDIWLVVHGDDFISVAEEPDYQFLAEVLRACY